MISACKFRGEASNCLYTNSHPRDKARAKDLTAIDAEKTAKDAKKNFALLAAFFTSFAVKSFPFHFVAALTR